MILEYLILGVASTTVIFKTTPQAERIREIARQVGVSPVILGVCIILVCIVAWPLALYIFLFTPPEE